MGQFKKVRIGFVLANGFRAADVIEIQAVLGMHLRNKIYFIAENKQCVYGKSGFAIIPNATFRECPPLDVLIIGEQLNTELENKIFIEFLRKKVQAATYVIGVSNGVIALAKCGVLTGLKATTDRANLSKLETYGVIPVNRRETVIDGRFYTSGPSTGGIESAFMILRKLRGDFITGLTELTLEYNPQKQFATAYYTSSKKLPELTTPLKVAVLMPPFAFAPDIIGALDVFGSIPKTEIYYVWKEKGKSRSIASLSMMSGTTFNDCPQVDVLIVGAVMPNISADQEVLDFLMAQEKNAKAIISICAGVFVIGGAGLLKNKNAASNFHMTSLLPCVGAIPSYNEVQVDEKIYSAGPAVGSYEAALMAVNNICGKEWAAYIEQEILEYEPHPVMKTGSPELGGRLRTLISKLLIAPMNPVYKYYARKGYKRNKR